MVKVTILRRICQITFFFLIVYLGVAGVQSLGLALKASQEDVLEGALTAQADLEVLDTYGPVKTCRYVSGDARLFKGCSLYFFSTTLTTFTAQNLAFILPHLLFFFVLAFIFGRAFCGWVCPMGFLEEIMVYVRKKLSL